MQSRIYVVTQRDKPSRLVEANNAAQAVRHCAQAEYSTRVATPKDIAALLVATNGVEKAFVTGNHAEQNQGE